MIGARVPIESNYEKIVTSVTASQSESSTLKFSRGGGKGQRLLNGHTVIVGHFQPTTYFVRHAKYSSF